MDAHKTTRQGKIAKAARPERCSAATVPAIISQENDADIITALRRGSALPKNFIGIMSRAIWILRRAARTAKDSLRQSNNGMQLEGSVTSPTAGAPGQGKNVKDQVMRDHVRLKHRLEKLSLDMVVIAGDGNCLFRSSSHQLFGCETHHEYVRSCAVDYMREHAEDFLGFFAGNVGGDSHPGREFNAYLVRMSRGRTWGDELTLRAICNFFGCHIHVVTSQEHNWYLRYAPDKLYTPKHVFLAYISPAHYNAITLAAPQDGKKGSAGGKGDGGCQRDAGGGGKRGGGKRGCKKVQVTEDWQAEEKGKERRDRDENRNQRVRKKRKTSQF